MSRYEDYDCYYNTYYTYSDIIDNCDDLYIDDVIEDENDNDLWDNYYHNIADELIEE